MEKKEISVEKGTEIQNQEVNIEKEEENQGIGFEIVINSTEC